MATASSPSPRPANMFACPSPSNLAAIVASSPSPSQHSSHHSVTSPTPPPRPPSSPGISVFAPRPMRVPMYRPQFSRPVFLYDSSEAEAGKENTQAASSATRRSSVASTGIPEESMDKIIYSPTKDVLEELYKIVRPGSASSTSTNTSNIRAGTSSPNATFIRPQPLHPRSPNAAHRRNTSDASDGGLSSILGGLSVITGNARMSPDSNSDWRMRSPVARRNVGNPMVRDPSFQGETPKKDS